MIDAVPATGPLMTVNSSSRQISLIGLGLLGSSLARRLISQGWQVIGFDLSEERQNRLIAEGGTASASLADCVERSRYCVFCLPDENVSRGVLTEVLSDRDTSSELIILDMTTGAPDVMQENAVICADRGVSYLDACVGGSSVEAEQGEAILMVGGESDILEACRDLLSDVARQVFHVGPAGDGARMKLVTNLVLGLERMVLAEGLHLANAFGLNLNKTLEILKEGPARSHAMTTKGPKMIEQDWTPQARLDQHWKDVKLILKECLRTHANLPLSELHEKTLRECHNQGWGELDNSAILYGIFR